MLDVFDAACWSIETHLVLAGGCVTAELVQKWPEFVQDFSLESHCYVLVAKFISLAPVACTYVYMCHVHGYDL